MNKKHGIKLRNVSKLSKISLESKIEDNVREDENEKSNMTKNNLKNLNKFIMECEKTKFIEDLSNKIVENSDTYRKIKDSCVTLDNSAELNAFKLRGKEIVHKYVENLGYFEKNQYKMNIDQVMLNNILLKIESEIYLGKGYVNKDHISQNKICLSDSEEENSHIMNFIRCCGIRFSSFSDFYNHKEKFHFKEFDSIKILDFFPIAKCNNETIDKFNFLNNRNVVINNSSLKEKINYKEQVVQVKNNKEINETINYRERLPFFDNLSRCKSHDDSSLISMKDKENMCNLNDINISNNIIKNSTIDITDFKNLNANKKNIELRENFIENIKFFMKKIKNNCESIKPAPINANPNINVSLSKCYSDKDDMILLKKQNNISNNYLKNKIYINKCNKKESSNEKTQYNMTSNSNLFISREIKNKEQSIKLVEKSEKLSTCENTKKNISSTHELSNESIAFNNMNRVYQLNSVDEKLQKNELNVCNEFKNNTKKNILNKDNFLLDIKSLKDELGKEAKDEGYCKDYLIISKPLDEEKIKHVKKVNEKKQKILYTCTFPNCGNKYTTKAGFIYHLKDNHSKINQFKPFTCNFSGCTKKFKNANGLKYHEDHAHNI